MRGGRKNVLGKKKGGSFGVDGGNSKSNPYFLGPSSSCERFSRVGDEVSH